MRQCSCPEQQMMPFGRSQILKMQTIFGILKIHNQEKIKQLSLPQRDDCKSRNDTSNIEQQTRIMHKSPTQQWEH